MQLIRESMDEAWRLLRLFAVGCAWSVPLLLAVFVNANPGVASHPRLAAAVEAVQWPMIMLAPLASLGGIALVAWLMRDGRRGSLATVGALFGWSLAAVALFAALSLLGIIGGVAGAFVAIGAAVLIGLVVTVVVLARRRWWLAAFWAATWLSLSAIVWFAGARTSEGGDDLGSGLLLVVAGSLVLGVSAFGALVAFVGPRIAANLRYQSELLSEVDGTI